MSTPKSTTVTLRANGGTLRLVAHHRADGSARTFAVTTDAAKHRERGMTERHASMDAALTALTTMTTKAERLGWKRTRTTRVDAFSTLPAPPAPKGKK